MWGVSDAMSSVIEPQSAAFAEEIYDRGANDV
jgi:hypothetical protein